MARKSSIEKHPKRKEIEKALLGSGSLRNIAERYSVSQQALIRWRDNHLSKAVAKADDRREERTVLDAAAMLEYMQEIRENIDNVAKRAMEDEKFHLAVAAFDKQLKYVGTVTKLWETSMAAKQSDIAGDITKHPQWPEVQMWLAKTLKDYPEALEALRASMG